MLANPKPCYLPLSSCVLRGNLDQKQPQYRALQKLMLSTVLEETIVRIRNGRNATLRYEREKVCSP